MWQPGQTLDDIEKEAILRAFRFYGGNKTKTAQALGISIRTLEGRLESYERKPNGSGHQEVNSALTAFHAGRISVEPTTQTPAQHALPVSERQEVQSLSPSKVAAGNSRKAR